MEVTSKYHTPWSPDSPPDWASHNRGVTPIFFVETVTLFEGDGKNPRIGADGKPLTRDMEFVRIVIAGDGLAEAAQPVDDAIRERFSEQYAAWKENREAAHQGYSLEEWPVVNKKQINELNANNIFSVKDLAALSDGNIHSVTHGRALREKAIAWLQDKEDSKPLLELAEKNANMQAEIEALQRKVVKLAQVQSPKPKARQPMSAEQRAKLSDMMKARHANKVAEAPQP